jgi:hypothetical protein
VDLKQLVLRIEKLAGIKLSDRVHSYFKEDHNDSFTLAGYDIVSLDSTYIFQLLDYIILSFNISYHILYSNILLSYIIFYFGRL